MCRWADKMAAPARLPGRRSEGLRVELQTKSYDRVAELLRTGAGPAGISTASLKEGTEPWFQLPFLEAPLEEELLRRWEAARPSGDLALPERNEFIPTDFSLRSDGANGVDPTSAQGPGLVQDEPGLRLWHKLDRSFLTPRSAAYFLLYQPPGYPSGARGGALQYLASKLLEEDICELAYLADTAGLYCHVSSEGAVGTSIKVWGFSHKLPVLAVRIFEHLARLPGTLRADPGIFDRVREACVRKYKSHNLKPSAEATWYRLYALKPRMWHSDDEQRALESVTLEETAAYLEQALAEYHVEAMVHGNVDEAEARSLAAEVRARIEAATPTGARRVLAEERLDDAVLRLPSSSGPGLVVCVPSKNPEERNSALEVYLQCAVDSLESPRDRAMADLLEQAMSQPCFDELRTKQQLGYTVHCGARVTGVAIGFAFHLVSGNYPAGEMDARVESFLSAYRTLLEEMTAEEFEQHRSAIIAAKLVKDRGMTDETDRHWYHVTRRSYTFQARELEVEELRRISQKEAIAWFDAHLAPASAHRRRVVIRVCGRQHWDAEAAWEAAGPTSPSGGRPNKRAKNGSASKTSAAGKGGSTGQAKNLRMEEIPAWRAATEQCPSMLELAKDVMPKL